VRVRLRSRRVERKILLKAERFQCKRGRQRTQVLPEKYAGARRGQSGLNSKGNGREETGKGLVSYVTKREEFEVGGTGKVCLKNPGQSQDVGAEHFHKGGIPVQRGKVLGTKEGDKGSRARS